MSDLAEILGRTIARREGRAVISRTSFSLVADPVRVFAIAPIKMVAEEIVQALAFGDPDGRPTVMTRWNPLSRDASDLEVFAAALDVYVAAVTTSEQLPRIWVPTKSALTVLELLGYRYRTNRSASRTLQRMGAQCRAIANEATYEGQQAIAVASDLLAEHVYTGQMPTKDGHLGALLAWIDPVPGRDPAEVADERALIPASGVLERSEDDRVEALRRQAKGRGRPAAAAQAEIERILARAVNREWDRLLAARSAFWRLPLAAGSALPGLEKASRTRLLWRLNNDRNTPTAPDTVSEMIDRYAYAADLAEDARVRDDERIRRRARAKGRAISGRVVNVDQPRSSRKPCDLTIATTQPVLRIRRATALKTLDGRVAGTVTDVRGVDPDTTEIDLSLTKGVQRSRVPRVGSSIELVDTAPVDMSFVKNRVRQRVRTAASPLVYGSDLTGTPTSSPRRPLSEVANDLRRAAS